MLYENQERRLFSLPNRFNLKVAFWRCFRPPLFCRLESSWACLALFVSVSTKMYLNNCSFLNLWHVSVFSVKIFFFDISKRSRSVCIRLPLAGVQRCSINYYLHIAFPCISWEFLFPFIISCCCWWGKRRRSNHYRFERIY